MKSFLCHSVNLSRLTETTHTWATHFLIVIVLVYGVNFMLCFNYAMLLHHVNICMGVRILPLNFLKHSISDLGTLLTLSTDNKRKGYQIRTLFRLRLPFPTLPTDMHTTIHGHRARLLQTLRMIFQELFTY